MQNTAVYAPITFEEIVMIVIDKIITTTATTTTNNNNNNNIILIIMIIIRSKIVSDSMESSKSFLRNTLCENKLFLLRLLMGRFFYLELKT